MNWVGFNSLTSWIVNKLARVPSLSFGSAGGKFQLTRLALWKSLRSWSEELILSIHIPATAQPHYFSTLLLRVLHLEISSWYSIFLNPLRKSIIKDINLCSFICPEIRHILLRFSKDISIKINIFRPSFRGRVFWKISVRPSRSHFEPIALSCLNRCHTNATILLYMSCSLKPQPESLPNKIIIGYRSWRQGILLRA